jgi:hypothetical protein
MPLSMSAGFISAASITLPGSKQIMDAMSNRKNDSAGLACSIGAPWDIYLYVLVKKDISSPDLCQAYPDAGFQAE